METVKKAFDFLNDPVLVHRFQKFCGLERVSVSANVKDESKNQQNDEDKSFLRGDKGVDSMFSAVDRDSRFISQEELVTRHIQHIRDHRAPNSPTTPKGDLRGRIVPRASPVSSRNSSPGLKEDIKLHRKDDALTDFPSKIVIKSKALYYLFRFGSSLGYEAFYATFFPVWTWNIDGAVCRRVVLMWVLTMYIGQVLKDILKMPRPSPKIVIQMEPMYVSEYGMPSTHAMIGFSVPFSLLYFCSQRYEFPFAVGLAICTIWCLLICLSRIYLGMHSISDILGGLLLVSGLFALILPFADAIDTFQLTFFIAPFVMFVVHLIPGLYYPQTMNEEIAKGQWGPTWADTVTILAAGAGISIGSWLNYQMGLITAPTLTTDGPLLPPPYPVKWPSGQELTYCLLRVVVGLGCLATVRIAGKTMAYLAVCKATGVEPGEVKGKNLVRVELPVKFFTYGAVGMAAAFFIPALFRGLNIARDTVYTEV